MTRRIFAAFLAGGVLLAGVALVPLPGAAPADARTALRQDPLAGSALARLAGEAPDPASAARFWALAAQTGWRDTALRRTLFDRAVAAHDPAAALREAEALLRQNTDRVAVAEALGAAATRDPAMRRAVVAGFSRDTNWAARTVGSYGSGFDDATLEAILAARDASGAKLSREQMRRLVNTLLREARPRAAAGAACRIEGLACGTALPAWPDVAQLAAPVGFGWELPRGYGVDARGLTAEAGRNRPRPAATLLALPAGNYVLVAERAPADWRFAFTCGDRAERPAALLEARTTLAVPANCPVQTLSLRPDTADGARGFGRLRLEPAE